MTAFHAADSKLSAELERLREQQADAFAAQHQAVESDVGRWDELDLEQRREFLDLFLSGIMIGPAKKRGRGFDPAGIELHFRDPATINVRFLVGS